MSTLVAIDVGLTALGWAAWTSVRVPIDRRKDSAQPVSPDSCGVVSVPGRVANKNRSADRKKNRTMWINNARWIHAAFVEEVLDVFAPDVMATEWPEFRSGNAVGMAAAGGEVLTKLALCAGCHMQQAWDREAEGMIVPVSTWKGMLKKDVTNKRIVRAIGKEAKDGTLIDSHAWDAVGIGLHVLGFPMDHACFSRGGNA